MLADDRMAIKTERGASLEAAGPELLARLLVDFEHELRHQGFPFDTCFNPPATPSEVRLAFEPFGVEPPNELVTLLTWRNGERLPKLRHETATPLFFLNSVERIIDEYVNEPNKGLTPGRWRPQWFLWADKLAVATDDAPDKSPLIRAIWPESQTEPDSTFYQVVSMCTPFYWWLQNLRNGAYEWDVDSGNWVRNVDKVIGITDVPGYV